MTNASTIADGPVTAADAAVMRKIWDGPRGADGEAWMRWLAHDPYLGLADLDYARHRTWPRAHLGGTHDRPDELGRERGSGSPTEASSFVAGEL